MRTKNKMTSFVLSAMAAMMMLALTGCGDVTAAGSDDSISRFSLHDIYSDEEVSVRMRFNTRKIDDETAVAYEKLSEKWNLDLMRVAQMRNGPDSLK